MVFGFGSYLIVAVYLAGGSVSGQSDEGWKEIHYKIYATTGKPIEPTKTRLLMQQLVDMYTNQQDEATLKRYEKLAPLLEVSNISRDKCHVDILEKQDKLLIYEAMYSINVVPYLRYYRREQFKTCILDFVQEIEWSLENIDEKTIEKMRLLRESIEQVWQMKVESPNIHVPPVILQKGVLEFMKKDDSFDPDQVVQHKTRKIEFEYSFSDLVVKICSKIVPEFKPIMTLMGSFRYDKLVVSAMDSKTNEWIANYEICDDIRNNSYVLYIDTYERMKMSNPHTRKSRFSRLFRKFKGISN